MVVATLKSRALSQLTEHWRVTTSVLLGNRLAFVVVRGEQGFLLDTLGDGYFVVSKWRWNHAYHQFLAAHKLCAQLNDILLENAPVIGPDAVQSLLADIDQSEELAKKALALGDRSTFVTHKDFANLCRRRLAKATDQIV